MVSSSSLSRCIFFFPLALLFPFAVSFFEADAVLGLRLRETPGADTDLDMTKAKEILLTLSDRHGCRAVLLCCSNLSHWLF
jgi:hypothetical protein